MARTAQIAKKTSKTSEKPKTNTTKETRTSTASPNASTLSTSSTDSIDFLSNPNAMPVPSDEESVEESTQVERAQQPSQEGSTFESPDNEEAEVDNPQPLPKPPKTKSKAKPNDKSKDKAETKSKKNRKQDKPVQRKKQVYREINRLRDTTELLIPKAPFQRLVREIMTSTSDETTRITGQALAALHVSSETYLTQLMEDSYLLTLHRQRVTLLPRDIQITLYIRGSHS